MLIRREIFVRRRHVVLACLSLVLLAAPSVVAQVKINLPTGRYSVGDEIRAKVENRSKSAIAICIDIGRTSMNRGQQESTPSPFWVEKKGQGKRSMLLAPDDLGFFEVSQVVASGEWLEFPLRLLDKGTLRLRLQYWQGDLPDLNCMKPGRRAKIASSPDFVQTEDHGRDGGGAGHGKSTP
ncbi:MAG: hypothetical protein ACRD40_16910 [Candidatus Acidiferrales bacterium]